MNLTFGEKIREARKLKHLTQKQLADIIGAKHNSISDWENDKNKPDPGTIELLCGVLNMSPNHLLASSSNDFSPKEKSLIETYRKLDDHGRQTVDIILNRETARTNAAKEKEELVEKLRSQIPKKETVYHFPEENTILSMVAEPAISYGTASRVLKTYIYLRKIACASTGFYFDDIPTETMEAPYLDGTDFIIGVNGDSMEPDYFDGDMLYVKKVNDLNYGDVGIFTINNECFLKEYGQNGLISHNNRYNGIPGNEAVRLIGKVIGKVPTD